MDTNAVDASSSEAERGSAGGPGGAASERSVSSQHRAGPRWRRFLTIAGPAAIAMILVAIVVSLRDGAEATVARFATWLPVGYAFGAGMVATVNPCGFLMLPSYLSYQLGSQEPGYYEQAAATRAIRALLLGAVATVGFVLIFAITGSVIAAGGQWLVSVFPYAGIAIGIAMALTGLWLLITHGTFGILAASRLTVTRKRNLGNALVFGIIYALGSLSCTLPVFLVVVGGAVAGQGALASLGQFFGYALGMGAVLTGVTLGVALFEGAVARWMRAVMPYTHRLSALFLFGAGAYLVYYWITLGGLF